MSVNIKDAEEKKLVIGYIKNIHRKKKNPFTNKEIYNTWLNFWSVDFRIGDHGRCPIMYSEQLVLSKNKHRNGINPPEHYKEYTAIIDTVRELFNTYYNPKKSTRFNAKPYIKLLIECKYLKCYAINHQIYYCDNDNRIDDIGKLSIDKEPEGIPGWCPLIYISNLEQEAV